VLFWYKWYSGSDCSDPVFLSACFRRSHFRRPTIVARILFSFFSRKMSPVYTAWQTSLSRSRFPVSFWNCFDCAIHLLIICF
jgi:hypothetical protein